MREWETELFPAQHCTIPTSLILFPFRGDLQKIFLTSFYFVSDSEGIIQLVQHVGPRHVQGTTWRVAEEVRQVAMSRASSMLELCHESPDSSLTLELWPEDADRQHQVTQPHAGHTSHWHILRSLAWGFTVRVSSLVHSEIKVKWNNDQRRYVFLILITENQTS